jgi:gliding motility-associated-like protein
MDQKQQDSLGKLPQAGVVSETSRRELVSPEIKEEEMLEVFRKPTLNATESIEVVQEVVVADKSEADLALWNEEKVTTIESVPSKREVPNKVLIHSNDAIQNCRGRLSVECLEDVDGPWELSVFSNSGFAQYEVGCGLDLLTKQLGKQLRWKGKVNVKNSQWVTFWISAHFEDGCRDTVYLNRMVQPNPTNATWLIPTVFTPNHDGYNDSFYVQIPEPMEYEVLIVDNTGNHVFKSRNVFEKWGGNYREMPVPSGNYRLILKTRYAGEREPSTKSQVLVLKRN